MSKLRSRTAVAPIRSIYPGLPATMSVGGVVSMLAPADPVYCVRPRTLQVAARCFVSGFQGDVLYAVKCNPEPSVLRALWRGGIRHFDCASPNEIRLVRQMFPAAEIHYMHPIKPESAILEAYRDHGVRDFSLDSEEEVEKILRVTDNAADLGLFVRLALPKGQARVDLSGKFGADAETAARILRRLRPVVRTLGICFHVGSQSLEPQAYAGAVDLSARITQEAGVAIDVLDVGGGFPVSYPGETPPALDLYFEAIRRSFERGFTGATRLYCEPGRALVAAGASVLVRVEARRGNILHINDGVYGSLSDAGVLGMKFPARLIRDEGVPAEDLVGFSFYGPTCDSADFMAGPFDLPVDAKTGDWIELGQLGAYGSCLRTAFNGFDRMLMAEVTDPPLLMTPGYEVKKQQKARRPRPVAVKAA